MNRPILKHDIMEYNDPNETLSHVLAQALNKPEKFIDENGYEVQIWGGDVHPTKCWIVWVDYYKKMTTKVHLDQEVNWLDCNYYFRIKADEKQVFEWIVETYNPFFGAGTLYLHWHDDEVIYIYIEKHRIYGVTANLTGISHHIDIGRNAAQIRVDNNIVTIVPMNKYEGYLNQYRLPDWKQLDPLPEAKAREMGLLEET